MAKRQASRTARKKVAVKDLSAGDKRARKVKGGGGGVPGLPTATTTATTLNKVGAVGPCFRPVGVVAPCDRLR